MKEMVELFQAYAQAFEQRDVAAITALYAFPAHVSSDVGEAVQLMSIPSAEAFAAPLNGVLELYRKVGCKRIRIVDLDVHELSPRLRRVTVQWGLLGLADLPLYDFTTSYVVARVENGWRVVSAVAHDELQRYRQFIGR